jgi:hypothetical protein
MQQQYQHFYWPKDVPLFPLGDKKDATNLNVLNLTSFIFWMLNHLDATNSAVCVECLDFYYFQA